MKNLLLLICLFGSMSAMAHDGPPVPEPMDLKALTSAFGWDIENAEITTQKVTDNLYVLFGTGGNIAVSVGGDGVFIVDDQFPTLMPKIQAAIAKLGGEGVDFAVNTHWHFDHAEGNLALGPQGTYLVAQENSRTMMTGDHVINLVGAAYEQKAYPDDALPDITFTDTMQFHFNGQQVDLWHFGPAHTTGDAAIYFRGDNAVHLGDVFNKSGFPFIDAGNGGHLDGVIAFCEQTMARINKDTVVIPGHGKVSDYQGLADYIEMLKSIRATMMKLINDGATLEEVIAAKPTKKYDAKVGTNSGLFINRAYMSLTHRHPK
ncbi:MAG: MBL fold metallo-hydrolase [Gammaproteobacteria bacterium]|nr:MBL fold metallo-hydrolase [Gammaproteobacteria bacterium]